MVRYFLGNDTSIQSLTKVTQFLNLVKIEDKDWKDSVSDIQLLLKHTLDAVSSMSDSAVIDLVYYFTRLFFDPQDKNSVQRHRNTIVDVCFEIMDIPNIQQSKGKNEINKLIEQCVTILCLQYDDFSNKDAILSTIGSSGDTIIILCEVRLLLNYYLKLNVDENKDVIDYLINRLLTASPEINESLSRFFEVIGGVG